MNGRGLLLVLLSMGFVVTWQQDSAWQSKSTSPGQEVLAYPDTTEKPARDEQPNSIDSLRNLMSNLRRAGRYILEHGESVSDHGDSITVDELGIQDENRTFVSVAESGLSLPPGIACGQYHVVNNAGCTLTVRVTGCDLSYASVEECLPPRDLYVSETHGQRWFFVRLVEEEGIIVQRALPDILEAESENENVQWRGFVMTVSELANDIRINRQHRLREIRKRWWDFASNGVRDLRRLEFLLLATSRLWENVNRNLRSSSELGVFKTATEQIDNPRR